MTAPILCFNKHIWPQNLNCVLRSSQAYSNLMTQMSWVLSLRLENCFAWDKHTHTQPHTHTPYFSFSWMFSSSVTPLFIESNSQSYSCLTGDSTTTTGTSLSPKLHNRDVTLHNCKEKECWVSELCSLFFSESGFFFMDYLLKQIFGLSRGKGKYTALCVHFFKQS